MPKRMNVLYRFRRAFALLLVVLYAAGCGGHGSSAPAPSGGSNPAFSLPLPKGLLAPSPDSDLVMTAQAVIDPGTPGARTVDLQVDLAAGRVTGVIEGVPAGNHTVEIRYFINRVQVATVTLSADVVPGQATPVSVAPAQIHYVETVSDALFVAKGADSALEIFDRYSELPGGSVPAAPTRIIQGPSTGIAGPSAGSLFVDLLGGGVYLTNAGADSVTIWDRAASADGNAPPDRKLAGAATRLSRPTGIAVDPFRNRLYVVNRGGEILIWNNAAALTGEVPPAASVSAAGLIAGDHPVSFDAKRDALYVGNGDAVVVFERLGTLMGDHVDIQPVRNIQIAGKTLSQATPAVDPALDRLYLSSHDPNGAIYAVTPSSVTGQVAPAATLSGAETGLNQTSAVFFGGGALMALNQNGSALRVWHQADQKNGPASPTQILEWPPPAAPTAVFYAATQNIARDQAQVALTIEKPGNGHGAVTSDLPGINCGTTCAALFGVGDTVTLTASAEDNSTFDGWGGACSGTAPCVVAIDAAKPVTATFTLKPYTLSVSKAGTGTGAVASNPAGIDCGADCSESYNAGTAVTLTATPAADSNFTGWSGACTGAGSCIVTVNSAKSVAATFTLKKYTLTVTKAGTGAGTVTSGPAGINCGAGCSASFDAHTQVTLTATPTSTSNFTGWSGACAGSTPTCTVAMEAARSVTATFTLKTFTLTVTKSGNGTVSGTGISCGTDCSETYTVNTSVTLTATPAADSNFTGWSGTCTNSSGTCTVTMDGAKSVAASFAPKPVLTVTKTGSGTVTSSPAGINCGSDCTESYNNFTTQVTLSAAPAADYDFTGWGGACSGTGSCVVTMDTAKNVSATFTLRSFTLTVSVTGNGAVASSPSGINCGADCSESYSVNTQVTLTPTAASDSDFSAWSGCDSTSGTSCTVTMNAAKSVSATFTLKTYTLTVAKSGTGGGTVSSNPAGISCGATCSHVYDINTSVVLTAAANGSSVFTGWSGACTNSSGTCTVTMDAAKSVTATFTLRPVLTVTKSGTGTGTVTGTGINCGTDCSQSYTNFTTQVTLTATPSEDSNFTGWSGACTNGSGTCTVTMNAAKTVTATFTLKTYPLTVTKQGSGAGTVSGPGINCGADCGESYAAHTEVTLTAAPNVDSDFTGWTGCDTTPDVTSCTVKMESAREVIATFAVKTSTLTVAVTKTGGGGGTVTSAPAGIRCDPDCSAVYTYGTAVTLTANPDPGSVFTGWSGACTAQSGDCVVTMNSAQSVTAEFTKLYTLTVTIDPGTGGGTVTSDPSGINCGTDPLTQTDCSKVYPFGTIITLTPTPITGSHFVGWTGDCTGTKTPCVFQILSDASVHASFDLGP